MSSAPSLRVSFPSWSLLFPHIEPQHRNKPILGGPPLGSRTASLHPRERLVNHELKREWEAYSVRAPTDGLSRGSWSSGNHWLWQCLILYFFHEICRFTFIFPHDISSATLNNSILFDYFHFKMCPGVTKWRNTFADENSLVYADPSLGPSEQPSPDAVFLNTEVLTFCATLIKQWGLLK